MSRLKANLTYMAALADRKAGINLPPAPAYLTAPNLHLSLKLRTNPEGGEANPDPTADRDERDKGIKDLYARLQAAYPDVDPKNVPGFRASGPGQKPGAQGPGASQVSPTTQQQPQMISNAMPAPSG